MAFACLSLGKLVGCVEQSDDPAPGANPLDKPKHVTNTAIARLFNFTF